jgi:hypothetical protein
MWILMKWDQFEADVAAGIESGRYCPDDMPVVLYRIRKWVASRAV